MQSRLTKKINILIQKLIKDGRCDSLIVTALFKHVRELHEHTKTKGFRLLQFYCNCLVHVEMNRGLWLAEFFETINSTFQDNFKANNDDALFSSISEAISLGELRHELIDFLSINEIQAKCFERDDLWYAVTSMIACDLIGKKIKFPTSSRRMEEIKNRMMERNKGMQLPNLPFQLEFCEKKDENRTITWEISFTKGHNYPNGLLISAPLQSDCRVEVKDNKILLK
jgi:hypothetical protein